MNSPTSGSQASAPPAARREVLGPWGLLPLAALLLALLFAARALLLVDATSLWGDELSTARKSFQPSLAYLFEYLRTDTHPPLYYGLLWLWGRWLPQTAPSLRLFSWGAYLLGGVVMAWQTRGMALALPRRRQGIALALALLLAFCSPFPVRFSIEAKGYSLLVLALALALLARRRWLAAPAAATAGRRSALLGYGLALAAAGLIHYYGLFYAVALGLNDLALAWLPARRSARHLGSAAIAAGAALPSLGWIWISRRYLLQGSEAGEWIGAPDAGLFEEVLARALGPWPLPKLLLLALALLLYLRLRRPGPAAAPLVPRPWALWLDHSGLQAGLLLVVLVVGVSVVKPLASARYFVVLLPALVPFLSLACAALPSPGSGPARWLGWLVGMALVVSFWSQSFEQLDPAAPFTGSRETNDFRQLVLASQDTPVRLSPRAHHFRTAEQLLQRAGALPPSSGRWEDLRDLRRQVRRGEAPAALVLAETGGPDSVQRRIDPSLERLQDLGYTCRRDLLDRPHLRLCRCRRPA
ncbi:MAG: hypothetical protein VKJ66_00515 [Synechococcus sp.]|nr:hypothetical protein [Synechococcus sp.]